MLEPEWVYFQIPPEEMTFLTRVMEGCEYLGVVTALDGKRGVGFVRSTEDTAGDVRRVLMALPFPVVLLTYDEVCRHMGEEGADRKK